MIEDILVKCFLLKNNFLIFLCKLNYFFIYFFTFFLFSGFISQNCDITFENNFHKVKKGKSLSEIEGEWGRYASFDGNILWDKNNCKYDEMKVMDFTLKSDSRYRDDILLYKSKQEDLGQEAKVYLEEIQRKDRKLRAQNKH
jgi:hypothetical protein